MSPLPFCSPDAAPLSPASSPRWPCSSDHEEDDGSPPLGRKRLMRPHQGRRQGSQGIKLTSPARKKFPPVHDELWEEQAKDRNKIELFSQVKDEHLINLF
ncbi:hypothetical protein PAHAL_4G150900 [Panicum hallii]|uniref:Uncharacterized protein n=1 Tax=Panicum hallii TaxID=206008 RepID=A0A2T8JCX9_9POAL|nr:hypothetical protein PAHAL_4G150900 [Panicum hallii]